MRSNADSTAPNLDVIYIDNHLLVVRKPSGMLAQGDRTGDRSLLEYGKAYVKAAFNKPGDAFLGLVHRLDRPTSGVMVFARTSKAAARLSEQFRARRIGKIYWALVEGKTPREGRMVDTLLRAGPSSTVSERGQEAVLGFRRLRWGEYRGWRSGRKRADIIRSGYSSRTAGIPLSAISGTARESGFRKRAWRSMRVPSRCRIRPGRRR
jgi:23S rRNA-/tRNA-specific pseudouridylate synthase